MNFYQIQRREDGLIFAPKWGETGFKKTGKTYAKKHHATTAWKLAWSGIRKTKVELVEFEVKEVSRTAL